MAYGTIVILQAFYLSSYTLFLQKKPYEIGKIICILYIGKLSQTALM